MAVELHWDEFECQWFVLSEWKFPNEFVELTVMVTAAYDTFVGSSAGGANTFEVMVWLGLYGGVSPLSANGYPFTPIATPT